MKIVVDAIAFREHRYASAGDWFITEPNIWRIKVAAELSDKHQFLVALHELIEMALCLEHGITATQVDAFDIGWVAHDGISEPGDDPKAPYYREHQTASAMERFMAVQLGVDWGEYGRCVDKLSEQ
jgi:hypothetical protein